MNLETIQISRNEALKLYREYQKHRTYSEPIDWEVQRAYLALSRGKVIVRALESIKRAGLDRDFLPRLAICSATAKHCYLKRYREGSIIMGPDEWHRQKRKGQTVFNNGTFRFPLESFPLGWDGKSRVHASDHKAQVPLIPVHLRPKRGLANYYVLWEAEWERIPPSDPYLLRRIGKADLWLVVAHWDLTEVERAVLSTRV
jgi:hypothetical protein